MTPMQERKLHAELRGAREQRDEVQGLLRMSEAELDDTRGAVARLEAEVERLEKLVEALGEALLIQSDRAVVRGHVINRYAELLSEERYQLVLAGQGVRRGLLARGPANAEEEAMVLAFNRALEMADQHEADRPDRERFVEMQIARGKFVLPTEEA